MSVVPVASEQTYGTCAGCGAALVSDQRYCLECGAPASPVRLAFLDVLQGAEDVAARPAQSAYDATVVSAAGILPAAGQYAPAAGPYGQTGAAAWLRRNSAILSLLSLLALCLIAGLLIGHWASGHAPSKQVVEIKGLPTAAALQSASAPASSATHSKARGAKAASSSAAKEREEEEKGEARETAAEKAPPPPPKKVNLKKLSTSTGKKHVEEIEANGTAPIETG